MTCHVIKSALLPARRTSTVRTCHECPARWLHGEYSKMLTVILFCLDRRNWIQNNQFCKVGRDWVRSISSLPSSVGRALVVGSGPTVGVVPGHLTCWPGIAPGVMMPGGSKVNPCRRNSVWKVFGQCSGSVLRIIWRCFFGALILLGLWKILSTWMANSSGAPLFFLKHIN